MIKIKFNTLKPLFLIFSVLFLAIPFPVFGFNNLKKQKIETVFSLPGFSGGSSLAIENRIIELLQQADSSTHVHMSWYTFSRTRLALEIIKANQRGVTIEIVMDDKDKSDVSKAGSALNILVNGAQGYPGLNCGKKSCLTFCKNSCQGIHINHNKFILLSKLNPQSTDNEEAKFVVVQTSSNMTDGQTHNYNDLIIIKNDQKLYEGMLDYWNLLKQDQFKIKKTKTLVGENQIKVYFFPRLLGSDPVLNQLNEVVCDAPNSSIRLIQSRFDDSRVEIAIRLFELVQQGCDVKVIVRDEPEMNSPGKMIGLHLGSDLVVIPYKSNGIKVPNSIHSKVVLINSKLKGSNVRAKIVMTGSHNLNFSSLKLNDETLFKIKDEATYKSYLQYWNQVHKDSQVLQKLQ